MKISTKGRYALRVVIDIAEQMTDEYIPLKDIAARQEISEKYLESIIKSLVRNRLLIGMRGKGGGYKLVKPPGDYTVLEILQCTEDSLAPVACLDQNPINCNRASKCKTLNLWKKLEKIIHEYFASVTIDQLTCSDFSDDYSI